MAGKLTDLLNAGLTARLPLTGAELIEVAQAVGLSMQTRVVNVAALAQAVNLLIGEIPTTDPEVGYVVTEDYNYRTQAETFALGVQREVLGANALIELADGPDHTPGTFGVYGLSTGDGATGLASLATNGPHFRLGGGGAHDFRNKVRLRFLSGTDGVVFRAWSGYAQSVWPAPGGDCLAFTYDAAENGGLWVAKARKGAASEIVNLTVGPTEDEFQILGISVNADGTAAEFSIDGVPLATLSVVPVPVDQNDAGSYISPLSIEKTAGPAFLPARAYIDYTYYNFSYPGGRGI